MFRPFGYIEKMDRINLAKSTSIYFINFIGSNYKKIVYDYVFLCEWLA